MTTVAAASTPRPGGGLALTAYAALTLVMTWPLLPGLASDVPGDLGDALLNMWILGWGAEQVPRLAAGAVTTAEYWNANIFHPEPLALAMSEHLFGQVLQILPVYHLTGNLILAYNLLFLTSFALSGWGMYLLVRDLLGDGPGSRRAAFVAGLVFAFVPLRVAQVAHIQSLSTQWMPLALFGLRRFVLTGRLRALAGGSAALLMQHWSSGYYLIFFAPIVPLFVVHQLWSNGRLGDWRRWAGLALGGAVVAAGTVPFLLPYLEAQRVHGFERPLGEVVQFSADVYSYLTAPEAVRLWGGVIEAYPKAEGELFFGWLPWALALAGVAAAIGAAVRDDARAVKARASTAVRIAAWGLGAVVLVQSVAMVALVMTGGFVTSIAGISVRATNAPRLLAGIALAGALLVGVSPIVRQRTLALLRSPWSAALLLMLLAMWLSLGPQPRSMGRPLEGLGLYAPLYEHVPGFDGLRVPARYAMIAALFLSMLAGRGALGLMRATRHITAIAFAFSLAILLESGFAPMPVNQTWGDGAVTPPARVHPGADAPAVYHVLATLPDDVVVVEFPFGDAAWELRYTYYSTVHWKRLVNGYSGVFPYGYKARVARLQQPWLTPRESWQALVDAGTTHVIVHDDALRPGDAARVHAWLQDHFAVEIARFDGAALYEVDASTGR